MLPAVSVTPLDRGGASSADYGQQVELWRRVANSGPAKLVSALFLQMGDAARQVCFATGSDAIMDGDGAGKIVAICRDFFAPEAAGSAHQGVACFLQFARSDRTINTFLVESDLLRRMPESAM